MSTLTSYTSGTRPAASSNSGLCIFRSDTNAIEVSDGTDWQTYNSDGVLQTFSSNSYSGVFDGSADYISVASSSSLSISGSVSITALIRKDTNGVFGYILAKRDL